MLCGIPIPRVAYLEQAGADRASFRVQVEPPAHLGGTSKFPPTRLVGFARTDRARGGFPVFVPEEE